MKLEIAPRAFYRPDIDGLRSLAVMAVILFHTFPRYVPGGFIGVDVFFVISGYLITQIILGDLASDRFSIAAFYARRIRRIFPALILVLIATFALGWNLLLPSELETLCRNILASALFSANLMLLSEVGYFDIAAHTKPLLHLWSLGIEEQFYLVWPWTLWLIPRRWLVVAILTMLVASLALNVALIGDYPAGVFYLPVTRAWELLAGGLLTRTSIGSRNLREAAAAAGLMILITSFLAFNSRTVFPGWAAAIPVTGTMLLLMSEGTIINRFVFSNPLAVNVGLISYPLYLWHWPLLVFAAIRKFEPLTDLLNGLVIAATFLLSWLTYKFVELPIRQSKSYGIPLAACMLIAALAMQAPRFGFGPRLPPDLAQLIKPPANGVGWRVGECMLLENDPGDFAPDCADLKRPLIAIWGDSTASALIPGFRSSQESREFGLAQYTVSSCPPVLFRPTDVKRCAERNRRILDLMSITVPDVVILHAIWDQNDRTEDLAPTVEALRARHVSRIIILGPVPVWPGALPNAAADYYWRTRTQIPERTTRYFDRTSGDEVLRSIAAELNVEYISARATLCNHDGCLARIGNSLSASDTLHLTAAGSQYLATAVLNRLQLR